MKAKFINEYNFERKNDNYESEDIDIIFDTLHNWISFNSLKRNINKIDINLKESISFERKQNPYEAIGIGKIEHQIQLALQKIINDYDIDTSIDVGEKMDNHFNVSFEYDDFDYCIDYNFTKKIFNPFTLDTNMRRINKKDTSYQDDYFYSLEESISQIEKWFLENNNRI